MGGSSSRIEKDGALVLCRERRKFVKQAVDRRYVLAAAHVSYIQSLRNVGIALRRFAEAQVLLESSLSTSATVITEPIAFPDKSPSHSSYPSPSLSQNAEPNDSLNHKSPLSPICISPPRFTMNYMKSEPNAPLTIKHINPKLDTVRLNSNGFAEDSPPDSPSLTFLPPPPLPEMGSSWDFFDPVGSAENFSFNDENGFGFSQNFYDSVDTKQFREVEKHGLNKNGDGIVIGSEKNSHGSSDRSTIGIAQRNRFMIARAYSLNNLPSESYVDAEGFSQTSEVPIGDEKQLESSHIVNGSGEFLSKGTLSEQGGLKREIRGVETEAEREDPSEFITHRAKDFLSSIKDIEHRFFRASESGKEVSRMLEANKIQAACTEFKERSPASVFLSACSLVCCREQSALIPHEPPQHVTKFITWNRSTSSQSSSSKNPLATAAKDDVDDSGSDFVEDFCMISGSHSSTLDRLYAWERKLYDEVKASESIRKEYDRKCNQLKKQFARDLKPQVIDKSRAIVKDLHSQVKVAIQAVESISKRIERLRDEELQPQLVELIQGLIRMWKAMIECHHAQYITISLAYHAKSPRVSTQSESHRQVSIHLENEIDCFSSSFVDWIDAHISYIEALNGWLQNCILPLQERSSRRKYVFCPRRVLAPPIFVLCQDWLAGIKALPASDLSDAIKGVGADLHRHEEEKQNLKQGPEKSEESKSEKVSEQNQGSNLGILQASLTHAFDRLTKFAEASLKMYEDVRHGTESVRLAYANGRTRLGI